jgi:hypothetical protein
MAENGNGSIATENGNGLGKIHTKKHHNGICHDDSGPTVKASTIDELHSLQKKKSAPTTPNSGTSTPFANLTDEERQKMQLQSIRYILFLSHFLINQKINLYNICHIFILLENKWLHIHKKRVASGDGKAVR